MTYTCWPESVGVDKEAEWSTEEESGEMADECLFIMRSVIAVVRVRVDTDAVLPRRMGLEDSAGSIEKKHVSNYHWFDTVPLIVCDFQVGQGFWSCSGQEGRLLEGHWLYYGCSFVSVLGGNRGYRSNMRH